MKSLSGNSVALQGMTFQTSAVFECFPTVLAPKLLQFVMHVRMAEEVCRVFKAFSTMFTAVRPLTSMNSDVHPQV